MFKKKNEFGDLPFLFYYSSTPSHQNFFPMHFNGRYLSKDFYLQVGMNFVHALNHVLLKIKHIKSTYFARMHIRCPYLN